MGEGGRWWLPAARPPSAPPPPPLPLHVAAGALAAAAAKHHHHHHHRPYRRLHAAKGAPSGRRRPSAARRALRLLPALAAAALALRLLQAAAPALPGGLLLPPLGGGGWSVPGAGAAAGLADLLRLNGDPRGAAGAAGAAALAPAGAAGGPKLIPRIIHQTYAGAARLPPRVLPFMQTWRDANPGWEVRFYSDAECADFVRREFPEYADAYRRLTRRVERSDFFRYMVVLRSGGVYADIDTECVRPLDGLIHARDTFVAGWENEFASPEAAADAGYVRTRQALQWVFAAAPGHPALRELCDRVAAAAAGRGPPPSGDDALDTLERTGPGAFTDVVLAHARAHPPARRDDPWGVRLLPRVAFGAPRRPAWGLSPADAGVAVRHHFLGSWRGARRWFWQRAALQVDDADEAGGAGAGAGAAPRRWFGSGAAKAAQAARMRAVEGDAAARLYPVAAAWEPPFDVMTSLAGAGERQSGWDVSAALTAHGSWQPSVQPSRRPSLADALVGALGPPGAGAGALVDVGAGVGFLSLAAAARGHRVHAFEAGPAAAVALEASVAHNGFGHLVAVHRTPLGAPEQAGPACLAPLPAGADGGAAAGGAAGDADADLARGYASDPAAHAPDRPGGCARAARRAAGAAALPPGARVGALRVSANGWEPAVLRGFEPLLAGPDPPAAVAVEWSARAAAAAGGGADPAPLIEWMEARGYGDVSHSGYVCDARWYAVTYGVRRRGGVAPEELAALRQPTWCRLARRDRALLAARASGAYPETLLFTRGAPADDAGGGADGAAGAGAAGGPPAGGAAGPPLPATRAAAQLAAARATQQRAQALQLRLQQPDAAALAATDPAAHRTAAEVSSLAALGHQRRRAAAAAEARR